jgi:hypothetical protein
VLLAPNATILIVVALACGMAIAVAIAVTRKATATLRPPSKPTLFTIMDSSPNAYWQTVRIYPGHFILDSQKLLMMPWTADLTGLF